ncbi:MAG: hypothetical protein GQ524_06570, partial [Anaerolineales bacterium]|nr:hypothetical protein [Anaerolineales bacterium]
MARYYSFKDSAIPTVELAGGKGLSLLYSKSKGFNVPTAVVLSTEFFQPWMEQLKSSSEWQAFVQASDDERVSVSKEVKDFCQALVFSVEQKKTLTEIYDYLQSEGIILMAVRSSSPEE